MGEWEEERCGDIVRVEVAGRTLTLRPWTLADHLDTLALTLTTQGRLVRLDTARFASELVRRATLEPGRDPPTSAALEEVALWWAAGGTHEPEELHITEDGTIALASGTVRLRRWSWGERRTALAAYVRGGELDLVGFLRSMLAASVAKPAQGASESVCSASAVTGADVHRLVAAVVAFNDETVPEDPAEDPTSQAIAAATLRICRGFGWTPSQVDAAPAREIDAMLRLLDRVEAPAPPREAVPLRRGLARYPDAVIIEVGDG